MGTQRHHTCPLFLLVQVRRYVLVIDDNDYMHEIVCAVCRNFDTKILLRGGECKTKKNQNFSEKWQNDKLQE